MFRTSEGRFLKTGKIRPFDQYIVKSSLLTKVDHFKTTAKGHFHSPLQVTCCRRRTTSSSRATPPWCSPPPLLPTGSLLFFESGPRSCVARRADCGPVRRWKGCVSVQPPNEGWSGLARRGAISHAPDTAEKSHPNMHCGALPPSALIRVPQARSHALLAATAQGTSLRT